MRFDNKDIEFWKKISIKNNIFEISQIICNYLNNEFDIDLSSIYLLETDSILKRLWLEYNDYDEKQIETEFSHFDLPLESSLAGYVIKNNRDFVFTKRENGGFLTYLKKNGLENNIYKESVQNVFSIFSRDNIEINNCYIIPIIEDEKKTNKDFPIFNIKISLTLLNIGDFEKSLSKIREIIQLIKPILYNAISFHYARQESEINRKINFLENSDLNLENSIELIQDHFAEKLNATSSSYFYYDDKHSLLNINNLKAFNENGEIDKRMSKEMISNLNSKELRVIRADNDYVDNLINKTNSLYKFYNRNDLYKIFPDDLVEIYKAENSIIFPLFSDNFFGFLFYQTSLDNLELEKISNSYFTSFLKQATLLFKFKESKRFKYSSIEMNKKILKLTKKNPEIIFKEILYKLKSIIDCEALSIFSLKGDLAKLEATTDNSENAKKKTGEYLYKLNNESITGYCMMTEEVLNIFTVEKVSSFYPKIKRHSPVFVESENVFGNTTMLVVPFFQSDGASFLIRARNKINNISNGFISTTNFSKNDIDIIQYAGSIFQNYKQIFQGINDRNKLLSLLLHEVESPIKHIRNKIRKIELLNSYEPTNENPIISNVVVDITRNLELIRGWAANVETINILFQGQQLKPQLKEIDLKNIIENSIYWKKDVLRRTNRNLSAIKVSHEKSKLLILGDESHFYQIFLNLLENSIKYSNKSINSEINIFSRSYNDRIEIFIEDFGIGIEEHEVAKVFKLQYRSKLAKKNNYKGEGYGLWLTKKLLLANKSNIEIDSLYNPTRFKVTVKKIKS